MTALPIVRRELLVAGRRPWTYWNRCLAALLLLSVGAALAIFSGNGPMAGRGFSRTAFEIMASTALAGVLLAGVVLNSESLASERREGTLGLLFLTELTGLDVALGKLFASTVQGGCALVAMLPILALPLMAGGVALADFWCTALMLVSTLLLSSGIGLWASSRSTSVVSAYSLAVFALLLVCVVPVLVAWLPIASLSAVPGIATFELLSPIGGFREALGAGSASTPSARAAGLSAAMVGGMGIACVAVAAWTLRRTGRSGIAANERARKKTGAAQPRGEGGTVFADANAGRRYGWQYSARLPAMRALDIASVAGGSALAAFLAASVFGLTRPPHVGFITAMLVGYGLHVVFKVRAALAALGPWHEDVSGGGLELLLATPLAPEEIREGHREAVGRTLLRSKGLLVLANLATWVVGLHPHVGATGGGIQTIFGSLFFGGIASLFVDEYCIRNVGMRLALEGGKLSRSIGRTLLPVLVPPWIGALVLFICLSSRMRENEAAFVFITIELLQIGFAAALGRRSSLALDHDFRAMAVSRGR